MRNDLSDTTFCKDPKMINQELNLGYKSETSKAYIIFPYQLMFKDKARN